MSISLLSVPVVLLFGKTPHGGFCHHCERVGAWDEHTYGYRCRACGSDPVEDAEAVFVPFGAPGPEPVDEPRRSGRAVRRPAPRAGRPSLWPWLNRVPSPTL